ncbi:N-acetylmuramoyl-L-alanine amidase [Bacillus sp. OxB-1]|uniref:N-acetylmuramoyl-L-alanine amidase n=1 Tax=Bacillus sp. (strain OxB-1) TaxID=98228 RepID=UPI000581CBA9|nr:N-acetylmuramoyl-L-alanine amidase [Bacillus sp. OxB-1]BAQ08828.1 N-acetylmuramoyl-L-alanine amidase [Bacillus sp. OxB-1]BAQ11424.1 N-acetylmuramoyl-L-alanine amidase [Bacillus sp. OxB-1]BAQ11711.1 N-acetylmuramoyl-L-alanine amidase [Bacillus sp. OxB-1]
MSFIEKLAPFAVKHGIANGVLPSLIIAQGVLESASGTSELATKANNLFGIKVGAGWTGETYTKRTAEHKPDGAVYYIDAAFRKYPSYEGCVIDLVHKYTHGTGWEEHNRYADVLGETDYRKSTAAVKAAGYAADINYPSKLNQIIEQYGLTKYNKGVDRVVKIVLDAGHGFNTAGKRSPDGEREWSFNNKVLLACEAKLREYKGLEILRVDDPTGKTDVPLKTRTDRANNWGADVYVSIHHNALSGKWHSGGGIETFTMDHPRANPKSVEVAKAVHPRIVKSMVLRDRGIKKMNLHVLRETNMPAILTEGGFMDSTIDIHSMRNKTNLEAQGEAIAEGLAAYFKLEHNPKQVATVQTKREESDLEFTSGTLRKEFETFLANKAQRDIVVNAAVKAGYAKKWIKDLEEGKAADGDIVMLGIGALIRTNK